MLKTKLYNKLRFITAVTAMVAIAHVVFASGPNFNDTTQQPLTSNASGNLGLGSTSPGQKLDVQGTIRTMFFTMSGQTPVSGYVLTASDSAGDTTWTSAGAVGGWTITGNNVYETSGGNVGIGTTLITTSALSVMNGNVGVGTWIPVAGMDVETSGNSYFGGNVGIGTLNPAAALDMGLSGGIRLGGVINTSWPISQWIGTSPIYYTAGNVGIGTTTPGGSFDVWGSDSGETTGDFTINTAAEILSIGRLSSTAGTSAELIVRDRNAVPVFIVNAGHGTVVAQTVASYMSGSFVVAGGNVGIGSLIPGQTLDVQGTIRSTGLSVLSDTETSVNLGATLAGTVTMNLATGTYFYGTVTGGTTFAVSNYAASGSVSSFTLELTNGGSQTITWMSGTKWPGGTAPTLTAAGQDIIVCSTRDGATTWRCVGAEINSS